MRATPSSCVMTYVAMAPVTRVYFTDHVPRIPFVSTKGKYMAHEDTFKNVEIASHSDIDPKGFCIFNRQLKFTKYE